MNYPQERWKLTKDVSVADLLSIGLAAIAIVTAYTKLSERVTITEAAIVEIQRAKIVEREELASRLDRLENKLDRLIERR
jgi:hypothetical protein